MLGNNMNNRLNILELHRKLNKRNEKKSICYEKVLEICQKRILSQTDRDKMSCIFEFPEYIIGYPLFDLNECIKYCEKQLISNGFLVQYYFPNKFYISWDFDEIKKQKEQLRKQTPLVAVLPQTALKKSAPQQMIEMKPIYTNTTANNNTNNFVVNKQDTQQQVISHSSPPKQMTYQSTPISSIRPQNVQTTNQPSVEHYEQQITQYNAQPSKPPVFSSEFHNKMTAPLPLTPPKYDPFDIYSPSIHSPNSGGGASSSNKQNDAETKKSAIDNTFFANSFKQTLTSGIGSSKMFDYKPSGKLTLNL